MQKSTCTRATALVLKTSYMCTWGRTTLSQSNCHGINKWAKRLFKEHCRRSYWNKHSNHTKYFLIKKQQQNLQFINKCETKLTLITSGKGWVWKDTKDASVKEISWKCNIFSCFSVCIIQNYPITWADSQRYGRQTCVLKKNHVLQELPTVLFML